MSKLLLTGADGFTGRHLAAAAEEAGYEIFPLKSDIRDASSLKSEVISIAPTHIVHLAAISDVTSTNENAYYEINLFGTLNLLKALEGLKVAPESILLASSANIYGKNSGELIGEDCTPKPVNHYAMSKLAMEHMALNFSDKLPIAFTRPFNYTGLGHDNRFVIPKIVDHFRANAKYIELGNLHVLREYNDVRDIVKIYLDLLQKAQNGEAYNIASGVVYSLKDVLGLLAELTGQTPEIRVNPMYVRKEEIDILSGSADKLRLLIGHVPKRELIDTLSWMLRGAN